MRSHGCQVGYPQCPPILQIAVNTFKLSENYWYYKTKLLKLTENIKSSNLICALVHVVFYPNRSVNQYSYLVLFLCNIYCMLQIMAHLWKLGYAAEDIIGNIFRVTKSMQMSEELKLDFIKVITYS